MKWIIFFIITVLIIVWLARGRRLRTPADPEAKTIEQKNYYVKPTEDGVEPAQPDEDERRH